MGRTAATHASKSTAPPGPASANATGRSPDSPLQHLADNSPATQALHRLSAQAGVFSGTPLQLQKYAAFVRPANSSAAIVLTYLDAVLQADRDFAADYDRFLFAIDNNFTAVVDRGNANTAITYLKANTAGLAAFRANLTAIAGGTDIKTLPNYAAALQGPAQIMSACAKHLNTLKPIADEFEDWLRDHYPYGAADLQDSTNGSELPTNADFSEYIFGTHNGTTYSWHAGRNEMKEANSSEKSMYQKFIDRKTFSEGYTVPDQRARLDNAADFKMQKTIGGNEDAYILRRVVSKGEADAIRAAKGAATQKAGEAKWFTIGGGAANIASSGDVAHNNEVVWTMQGSLRRFFLDPAIHKYNENETLAKDMVEPYIRWRGDEENNVALSYQSTAVFNSMITSCKINGVEVKV